MSEGETEIWGLSIYFFSGTAQLPRVFAYMYPARVSRVSQIGTKKGVCKKKWINWHKGHLKHLTECHLAVLINVPGIRAWDQDSNQRAK